MHARDKFYCESNPVTLVVPTAWTPSGGEDCVRHEGIHTERRGGDWRGGSLRKGENNSVQVAS